MAHAKFRFPPSLEFRLTRQVAYGGWCSNESWQVSSGIACSGAYNSTNTFPQSKGYDIAPTERDSSLLHINAVGVFFLPLVLSMALMPYGISHKPTISRLAPTMAAADVAEASDGDLPTE